MDRSCDNLLILVSWRRFAFTVQKWTKPAVWNEALCVQLRKALASRWATGKTTMNENKPLMTEQQRSEIKRLCEAADVPDKSGEMLTEEGAQHFIADLKRQAEDRR